MIEVSQKEIKLTEQRDKLEAYLYIAIGFIVFLLSMITVIYLDVNKLDKSYKKSQEDLATMTIKTMEQQVLLSESEELLRLIDDMKQIEKEHR